MSGDNCKNAVLEPSLSPTSETVLTDTVNEDEPLIELETDKVSVEVTSPKTGVITEITVQEGQTVEVGTQLGLIGESGAKVASQSASGSKHFPTAPFLDQMT